MSDATANQHDWDLLLDRYIAGESTGDEAAAVRRWLKAHPYRAAAVEEMQRLRRETSRHSVAGTEPALRALQARIAVQGAGHRKPALAGRWAVPLSAALILAALIPSLYSLVNARIVQSGEPVSMSTAVTLPGQRARLQLPDGSIVTLGVASTLKYQPTFGRENREIILDGEAYFEVARNGNKPFVINGSKTVVTVLGTAFAMRSYSSDGYAHVAVADGKVSMRSSFQAKENDNPVILAAGDVGTLTNGTSPQVTHPANLAPFVAWKDGKLVFKNTPLSEVATQLERWYDVQVTIASDELNARTVNATFLQSSFTPDVLDLFAESIGLRYKQSGRHITFFKR